MIKKFNLKLIVFLIACLYSAMLSAQINTPSGAVVPFNSNPNYGGNGIMPTNLPTGGTYGKSQDAADAYNEWKANYTETCTNGIRIKFDEPNRTVSEGIAYGMQLAAYAADRGLFDGLYTYWKAFASPNSSGKSGKLMNWRINGCSGVSGTGSAADADVDAAWALLIAKTQWPTVTSPFNYGTEAANMIQSIRELELYNNQLINGDGWGFADQCRNPSYQSPAYYKTFKDIESSGTWTGAVSGAYGLINNNRDVGTGLISDWSNPSGVRNTCNPGGLGQAATDGYGYDAARNPWRMAQDVLWNNDASAKDICTKIANYISTKGVGNIGGPVYQNGTNYAGFSHNATFVSTFAMAVMGTDATKQALMNSMYTEVKNTKDVIKNSTLSGYFGNTLRCVSLFMMTGNFWKYGTTSFQDINVRKATTTVNILNGTTYDFQTQQTTAGDANGKMATFSIENLGFAQLNLTGTPSKVVLSGTNASDFILVQPTGSALALGQTTDFTVTFKPTTVGDKTATLTIASNDPDEPSYVITLIGTGTLNATSPKISVFDAEAGTLLTNNGTVDMGTSSAGSIDVRRFGIINSGDAALNISGVTATGTGYSVVLSPAAPTTVAIGDTGFVYVQVTSAAAGTPAGSFTIASDDNANAAFKVNLTSTFVACAAAVTANEVYQDYNANYKNTALAYTVAGFSENFDNPFIDEKNPSTKVAKLVRAATDYQGPRYSFCSTGTVNLTSTKFVISMLVYSPAAGVSIQMNLKTDADVANTITFPARSSVSVTTTKANQWERVYFNHVSAIGVTGIRHIEIYIDPTSPVAARTYYIDDIKLDAAPCLTDNSGIIQDFDDHNNVTLAYSVTSYTAGTPNDVAGGLNTSPNIGKFVKSATAAAYGDGIRYNGCGGKFDLSTKKYVSMLVYSSVANAQINLSPKLPDGADTDTDPDDAMAAAPSTLTVFANKWHRVYFDISGIPATAIPNVFGFDIFFDPLNAKGAQTYRIDDIRYETALPCVAGIDATEILNDFETNRFLNIAFPGETPVTPGTTYFSTVSANPSATGLNTSSTVGTFLRGTGATGTSFRFTACQSKLSLTPGRAIIDLKMYSPNANVAVVMSLKNAAGTSLSDVTDTIKVAGTWTNLRFDHSKLLNSTAVAFIDIIVDGAVVYSGASSTPAARTYYVDDLRYSLPAPEINVQANTTPAVTDIPTRGSFNMGAASIGDSTVMDFKIQNNGTETLTLTGTGAAALVLGGANPGDFVITTTQSFSTSISGLSLTGFTVKFKPTAAGARSASITIKSNDENEGTYIIYLNGTATAPIVKVLDGATTTSPIIVANNTTAINIGSSPVTVQSAAYTFSIKNTGVGSLTVTSVTASSTVFAVSVLSSTAPIAAGDFVTFTVKGTPAAAGLNTGFITIVTNDPATPSYKVNITVTGTVPVITVKDQALAAVANNNATAVSVGSAPVTTAAAAYTFTITNTGTAPLTVTSITPLPAAFVVSAISPTGPIAAGASATFTVTATPSAPGVNTGTITIVTNDLVTPSYKINVTVTGTVATVQVLDGTTVIASNNTTAVELPSPVVDTESAAKTFTIKNTGGAPLTIGTIAVTGPFTVTQVSPAGAIAAGATATFTVTGTPNSTSVASTGIITIPSNDPANPYKVNVSVIGTAAATAAVQVLDGATIIANNNTTAVALPSPVVNTESAPKTFTVKNNGTAELNVGTISVTGPFTVTQVSPAGAIAVGATATFTVTGKPTSTTVASTGIITIPSNDPASPYKVNVSVIGTEAPKGAVQVLDGATVIASNNTTAVTLPSPVKDSPSAPKTLTIKNTGAAALTIGTISVTGPFTVTQVSPAGAIAVGATATFTVSGTPTSTTVASTGIITILSDDPASPYVVNVSVIGTDAPKGAVQVLDGATVIASNNATAVSLPSPVKDSPSAAKTLTIKNTGAAALTIGTISVTGPFTVTQLSPAGAIAIGATATFTVSGTPNSTSVASTGIISISSDDPASPYLVNVSVIGTDAPKGAVQVLDGTTVITSNNATAVSLPSPVKDNASAPKTFTIKNTGAADLTVGTISVTGPFTVTQVSPAGAIAVGATATFTVSGTPNSTSVASTGIISISSDDPASPYLVNVSVIGTDAPTAAVQVLDGATVVVNNNAAAVELPSPVINTESTPKTFTIRNNGTDVLNIGTISVTGGVFTVTQISPAGAIAVGESATFTVTGKPNSTTVVNTGVVSIPSNDPATPYNVNVSVIGTSVPTSTIKVTGVSNNNTTPVFLGTAVENTSTAAYTFTVSNTGNLPLNISTITSSNPDFEVSSVSPNPIPVGGTGTFTVIATPTSVGTITSAITISSDDQNTPAYVINVSATGKAAPTGGVLEVLDGSSTVLVSNGVAVPIGANAMNTATSPYTFTLRNSGVASITINNIVAATGFTASKSTPKVIPPNETATFTVYGVPNNVGTPREGKITILNDGDAPFVLVVSVKVGTPTGVATALSATAIDLFPNPSTGSTNLEFNGSFNDVAVTIYTIDGNKVFASEYAAVDAGALKTLQVEELPSGIYIVEVATAEGKLVKRLIKQ